MKIRRSNRWSLLLATALFVLTFSWQPGHMQTPITVCDANCSFTDLQPALTHAGTQAGSQLILLQEGRTFTGDFVLPVHTGASSSSWVEIRTGVNATGVVQPLSNYPAAGIRVCQTGFTQDEYTCGLNGTTAYDAETRFAKIKASTNNAYAIRTVGTGSGTPVSYYRLKWLDFHAQLPFAGNSMIGILNDTANGDTGRLSHIPHHFEIEQILMHGDQFAGQFRGIEVNGFNVSVTNSHFYDVKAAAGDEGQVIWGNAASGTLIQNNYLSGGAETVFFGGGGTWPRPRFTVQAGASTTSMTLDRIDDLHVGQQVAVRLGSRTLGTCTATAPVVCTTTAAHGYSSNQEVLISGSSATALNRTDISWRITVIDADEFSLDGTSLGVAGTGGTVVVRASTEITGIAGNVVSMSTEPLPFAPETGALVESSIVADGVTLRYNYLTHPEVWRSDPMVATPAITTAAPVSGGTLAAGNYSYRIAHRRLAARGTTATSAGSIEANATVDGTSTTAVSLTWSASAGATGGTRIYGRTPSGQNMYWDVPAGVTTFIDTGTAGTTGTPPATGTMHMLKNVLEFKQSRNVLVEYNVIERSYVMGQAGPCVLFTVTQQGMEADSARIEDVVFRYNVVRRCGEFVQLYGRDGLADESALTRRISFTHNLFYHLGLPYGSSRAVFVGGTGGGRRQHPNRSPLDVEFNHNTFHTLAVGGHSQALLLASSEDTGNFESPIHDFTWKNNISYVGSGGMGSIAPNGSGYNTARLGTPPFGTGKDFTHNVLVDATCAAYTPTVPDMLCPTRAAFEAAAFTNTTTPAGFKVKSTSTYFTAASDGTMIGANLELIYPPSGGGVAIAESGNNSGVSTPDPLAISTTSPLPQAYVGQVYAPVTLATTGGVPPYTWAHTGGTLPTGLTFNAATAVLSGTPTVAVTGRVLTFRVTDSAGTPVQVTKDLSITVTRLRARSLVYNLVTEGAFRRRATCPTGVLAENIWDGDICWDDTLNKYKRSNVSGTSVTYEVINPTLTAGANVTLTPNGDGSAITIAAAAGGSSGSKNYTFYAGIFQAVENVPSGGSEFYQTGSSRIRSDFTGMTQCALYARSGQGAITTSDLRIEYWDGSAWVTTGISVPLGVTTGSKEGPYQTLAVGARADLIGMRPYITTGDGAADPGFTSISMVCKP